MVLQSMDYFTIHGFTLQVSIYCYFNSILFCTNRKFLKFIASKSMPRHIVLPLRLERCLASVKSRNRGSAKLGKQISYLRKHWSTGLVFSLFFIPSHYKFVIIIFWMTQIFAIHFLHERVTI
jgi:hypothetical protein